MSGQNGQHPPRLAHPPRPCTAYLVRLRLVVSIQGNNRLTYNLYLDPTGFVPWGDGSGGTQVYVANGPSSGTTVRLMVYGKVQLRQNVAAGDYHDMVTVILMF